MKIECIRNNGYKWTAHNGVYFKGYIIEDEIVLRNTDAVAALEKCGSFNDFVNYLKRIDGIYAIIVKRQETVWAAVDIARSVPLFYTVDLDIISDDAENIRKKKGIRPDEIDTKRAVEMYTNTYINGGNTIYKKIRQIEHGNAIEICQKKIRKNIYFKHISPVIDITREEAKDRLADVMDDVVNRMIKVVDNRPIVLSLSGGYDSRFLACTLKKHGIESVICYSYGDLNSFEVKEARKVADALGYEWHGITYTDADMESLLSEEHLKYYDYFTTHDFIVYLQNYVAMLKLERQEIIPKNSVIITGLCMDMATGSYVVPEYLAQKSGFDNEGVANWIYNYRFTRFRLKDKAKDFFVKEICNSLDELGIKVSNYQEFVSAYDCYRTGDDNEKWYLYMNSAHDYFGYQWLIPCWDRELLKFWYSLPVSMRINQNLYEEYIITDLGAQYGIGTKKYHEWNAKTPAGLKIKRFIGGLAVKVAYPLGIPIRRNADINHFAPLEVLLYKKIKQKKAVKSDRAGVMLLNTIYVMERRYGADWYRKIEKYIR